MSSESVKGKLPKALKDNECTRVEKLISNGVDVNQIDAKGVWPLQYAANVGCTFCVTLLLSRGADIRATATMEALSAVSIAANNGHIDALKCLLSNCNDESIISGVEEKQSPLHYACSWGKIGVVRYIVEKYPRAVYFKASKDAKCCTSLHVAAESGNVECMKVLLHYGADIEAVDIDGATALFYAVRCGKRAAVQFLHDRGACTFTVDRNGCLPLHIACRSAHVKMAQLLLKNARKVFIP